MPVLLAQVAFAPLWLGAALGAVLASACTMFLFWRCRRRFERQSVWVKWENQPVLREILARAKLLIWSGTVRRVEGRFHWSVEVMPQSLSSPLMRLVRDYGKGGFWRLSDLPDYEKMLGCAEQALTNDAAGYQQEFPVRDGASLVWLAEQVGLQRTGTDSWFLFGIISDVSATHEAEEAVRLSANRVRTILERTDCMVWQATVNDLGEGRLDWYFDIPPSKLQKRIFGMEGAYRTKTIYKGFQVEQLPLMNTTSTQAMLGGLPGYEQEFKVIRLSDSQVFWLHEQVGIERIDQGRWNLFGVTVDMTAHHLAEERRQQTEEQLQEIVRRVDCILWHGIVRKDATGDYAWIINALPSALYEKIFGGQPKPDDAILWMADRVPALPEMHLRSRRAFESGAPGYDQEFQVISPEGTLWLSEQVAIRPKGPGVFQVMGVILDITARRNAELQLQRASKLEAVGILAGGIAHDFNNILTAILGNLGLARYDRGDPQLVDEYIKEAVNACHRAKELTQQLLTFAKGGDPVRSAVNLPGIVNEVARFALHGSTARCEVHLPNDLWLVNADSGQLSQIVQNLVINASQAMPGGGVVTIEARNEQIPEGSSSRLAAGPYVALMVRDTGIGIASGDLAKIFDPYFTTKPGGSGLGLTTVYSIVRKHRGSIEVESEPGRGTVFTLRLPALRKGKMAEPATGSAPAEPMPAGLSGRVLVMDDEASIRRLAGRILSHAGLDVDVVEDGAIAVSRFTEAMKEGRPYTLLIMDLTVPGGMGGLEALSRVRELDPKVRAIVASGYSSDPVLSKYEEYGFSAMIAKPYEALVFLRTVKHVLSMPLR